MQRMPWRTHIVAFVKVAQHGHAAAPTEVLDAAFTEAKHALELDPLESRCHRILSTICLYRREYDMAEQHIRRAFDLNPNDADAMIMKGRLLAFRGKPEEALVCLEAAVRLNPLHPPGTWLISALPSIRCGALPRQRRRSNRCPCQTRGRMRGSRPAMPSLNRPQRQRQQSRRSCGCSQISRQAATCGKVSSLNAPKIRSFCGKGSSRQACRHERGSRAVIRTLGRPTRVQALLSASNGFSHETMVQYLLGVPPGFGNAGADIRFDAGFLPFTEPAPVGRRDIGFARTSVRLDTALRDRANVLQCRFGPKTDRRP